VTVFDQLLDALVAACRRHYGARLRSLLVYGSVGRRTPRPDSDIDLLIVADGLPNGRTARVEDFLRSVEADMEPALAAARRHGITPWLSPVFKTPEEVERGSPIFLDMIDDARVLHDEDDFMRHALSAFKARLDKLGAKRIWRGNAWYWDLKPDYQPGEVFEL
jgi:predicted nucleotidyltransferase